MSTNVVAIPVQFKQPPVWRGLGHFAIPLRRRLHPTLFLAAHAAGTPDDHLLRQILFLASSLEQGEARSVCDRLADLKPGSVEDIVRVLSLPPGLIDILAKCGPDPLEGDAYRTLARWSGAASAEQDGRRMQRLLDLEKVTTDIITAVEIAPDEFFPLFAEGRTVQDVDLLIHVLPDLITALPFFPDHAREFLNQRLCAAVGGRRLVKELRKIICERRKGAFRSPPSFADSRFFVITHPAVTVQRLDLKDSVRERILFEHAFLVGVRGESGSPGFTAFLLLEAVYCAHQAPAGFLLHPVILNADGAEIEEPLAANLREQLQTSAEAPIFLSPASLQPTALEGRLMARSRCWDGWN
jgi:hypothetical protein